MQSQEPNSATSGVTLPIGIGAETSLVRTVSGFDVQHFARLTGDFSAVHIDEEMMRKSRYGRVIVHGALLVGLISAASTKLVDTCATMSADETAVLLGFDRIRFVAPVFVNQTIRIHVTIVEVDEDARRATAQVSVTEEGSGEIVAVATNILKWVKNPLVQDA
jgi:3-hydroxybutyryl-CoA dehydratase